MISNVYKQSPKILFILVVVCFLVPLNSFGDCKKGGPCNDVGRVKSAEDLPPNVLNKIRKDMKEENKPDSDVNSTSSSATSTFVSESIDKPSLSSLRLILSISVSVALVLLAFKLGKFLIIKKRTVPFTEKG